ncbi:2167_t:CDS:2 [Gigaspora margarita]|uniref:2167_t:CDS:1 n=1 Tax=Gigaspora margarita TaxID=4874 RepID=A0ABN7VE13_GIGMA|nr:2167_t:CDS:2 [Gigaspora margarita]
MMSPGTDKPYDIVDHQVKNKKTWNYKSINHLVDKRKLMLEKTIHQSSIGIKKDEHEAPDNDQAETCHWNIDQNYGSNRLGPCYKNEIGVKNEHDKRKIKLLKADF